MPLPKAEKRVFVALFCAAVMVIALVSGMTAKALVLPKTVYMDDYTEPTPDTFRMKAEITQENGMLTVDGYACVEGERFEKIDTFIVLYPGQGEKGLRLPTKTVLSEEAYVAGGSLAIGQLGGFTSKVYQKVLPAGEYSVYISYRTDGHNILADTGKKVQVNA